MGANASTQFGPTSSLPASSSSSSSDSKQGPSEAINHLQSNGATNTTTAAFLAASNEVPNINSIGLMFSSKDKKLKRLKQKIKTKVLKKGSNHGQVFREFANLISIRDLAQLFEEYKATLFLKELSLHAESARPIASTIRNDLSELYDFKYNSDITLVYKGVQFQVHKAIVCVRCPIFRELLSKKQPGSVVPVNLEICKGLRVELLNDLLKFLYTGELSSSYDPRSNETSFQALIRISQECGVPNTLSHDLKLMLDTGIYSDATLCFQYTEHNSAATVSELSQTPKRCTCFEQSGDSFSCHTCILAARSPFFRNVILRQQRRNATLNKQQQQDNNLNQRIKIVLDESIIPRRFARVLLHVMYRDAEDLLNLVQSCVCKCSASSSHTSGSLSSKEHPQIVLVKEIMDLYEIARFLEIDYLVQSCEDLIIDLLSIDTLIPILKWSDQSHGSPYVRRQAICFLKEEFSSVIASSSLLCQLEFSHLLEALKSDFLEASELDILKAVFKWGEHHLTKQMEEREPNLLLSHSLTRKSLRKKEIDDDKLRQTIGELLALVRFGHILPIDSEFLANIAKRGFIDTLPPYMMTDDTLPPITAWCRNRSGSNGNFVRPRLFSPFYLECKVLLEERLGHIIPSDDNFESLTAILNKRYPITAATSSTTAQIPDALYMLDKANFGGSSKHSVVSDGDLVSPVENFHFCFTSSSTSSIICYEEIDKPRPNLPILEERILLMMRQREQELKTSPFCARALKIAHNRCQALRLIQLRVVREFGLPDVAVEVLHLRNVASVRPNPMARADLDDNASQVSFGRNDPCDISGLPPPPPRPASTGFLPATQNQPPPHHHHHYHQPPCDPFSYQSELKLETSSRYELESQFSSTESHRTLSEMIPDIAIATRDIANLDLTNNC